MPTNNDTGNGHYPNNPMVADVTYRRGAIAAVRECNLWWGRNQKRLNRARALVTRLSEIYDCRVPTVDCSRDNRVIRGERSASRDSSRSNYNPSEHAITLCGRWSLLTLLHEYAHSRFGNSERKAVKWSVNLFRKAFPEKFDNLIQTDGSHFLSRPDSAPPPDRGGDIDSTGSIFPQPY